MARTKSAILTATEQKTVDAVIALKNELKTATAALKEVTKAAKVANDVEAKQGKVVAKLQAKLDKLQPAKPEVISATGTGVGAVAKAA